MAVAEEDSPEIIRFQEFQNTPVSSAVIYINFYNFYILSSIIIIIVILIKLKSCEEAKNTDDVTSDAESRQNESESIPIEPQAGILY